MNAIYAIIWFVGLTASISLIFHFVGMRLMVTLFQEGWRWWQLPMQLASIALFGAIVLNHPFK